MSFVGIQISALRAGLFYHWDGPVHVIVDALLLVIAITWAGLSFIYLLVRRNRRVEQVFWVLCGIGLIRELFEAIYVVIGALQSEPLSYNTRYPHTVASVIFVFVAVVIVLLFAVPSFRRSSVWPKAKSFTITVLGFSAFSGAFLVLTLLQVAWTARNLNSVKPLRQSSPSLAALHPRRVIWLVLDELSYDQIYGHRFPGLQLKGFDDLAMQSAVFTNVIPAGLYTQDVLPSLIVGRRFDDVVYHTAGPLELHSQRSGKWETFRPEDTVFQSAVDAGYRTGIVGWFNPYCRLLAAEVDYCYWNNTAPLSVTGLYGGGDNTLQVTKNIFLLFIESRSHQLGLKLVAPQGEWGPKNNALHLKAYEQLSAQGDKILEDPSLNFLFLHMPIPHPPGIYHRNTGELTSKDSSYIDNLALADKYVAHVCDELKANGTWGNTSIVIMGDHSWRTNIIWNKTSVWTKEDQEASRGGAFDPRSGYIVHLAGQTTPMRIDTPFRAIRTRALLDALMNGQIVTPEQLKQWAQ